LTLAIMHTPVSQYPPALSPSTPRDANHPKMSMSLPQPYYRCGQTVHVSQDCHTLYDVCHIIIDKQNEFVKRMMADRNVVRARGVRNRFCEVQKVDNMPPLSSYNYFPCL
jgi:hypothetical protein